VHPLLLVVWEQAGFNKRLAPVKEDLLKTVISGRKSKFGMVPVPEDRCDYAQLSNTLLWREVEG